MGNAMKLPGYMSICFADSPVKSGTRGCENVELLRGKVFVGGEEFRLGFRVIAGGE